MADRTALRTSPHIRSLDSPLIQACPMIDMFAIEFVHSICSQWFLADFAVSKFWLADRAYSFMLRISPGLLNLPLFIACCMPDVLAFALERDLGTFTETFLAKLTAFRTSNLIVGFEFPPVNARLMESMLAIKRNLSVLTKSLIANRTTKWAEGIVVGLHPPFLVAISVEDMLAVKSDKRSSSERILTEFAILHSLFLWRLLLYR